MRIAERRLARGAAGRLRVAGEVTLHVTHDSRREGCGLRGVLADRPRHLRIGLHVVRDGDVPGVLAHDPPRRRIDRQIDLRHGAPVAHGARHQPAANRAVVRLMRVTGHDDLDRGVERVEDPHEVPREAHARVVGPARGLLASLVQHEDDRGDAAALQLGDEGVRRLRLVLEAKPLHRVGDGDQRSALERLADERDLHAAHLADDVRREDRPLRPDVHDVRGQVGERGARKAPRVRPPVALARCAPAVLQPLELRQPSIEVVVAHCLDVQTDLVHHDDRRLVPEHVRQERARAGEIARRHDDRARRVLAPQARDARGEERRATRGDEHDARVADRPRLGQLRHRVAGGNDDDSARPHGRLEVPVEVVDREDLHVRDGRRGVGAAGVEDRRHVGCARHEGRKRGRRTAARCDGEHERRDQHVPGSREHSASYGIPVRCATHRSARARFLAACRRSRCRCASDSRSGTLARTPGAGACRPTPWPARSRPGRRRGGGGA